MSITDELRGFANSGMSAMECSAYSDKLIAIADRIDAEHEESIQREHESAYDLGYVEGMGVANKADMRAEYLRGKNDGYDEGWDAAAKTMTESMVELPKDADDVPWSVGDRDEDGNVVTELRIAADGWWVSAGGICRRSYRCRHYHHAPTVEDVLHDFICDVEEDVRDEREIIAEYAAKLRLAEGEDE